MKTNWSAGTLPLGQKGRLISLFSQLRNFDGELISMPNGSIGKVRNLSSEWSRVNYAGEVGYDVDLDRVLDMIEAVAQEVYRDPQ